MSERKTTEVKFRCSPTFKATLAADADAAGQSMSEYIEEALGVFRSVRRANEVVTVSMESVRERGNVKDPRPLTTEADFAAAFPLFVSNTLTPGAVKLVRSDSVACAGRCRPWEFCTCKAGA